MEQEAQKGSSLSYYFIYLLNLYTAPLINNTIVIGGRGGI